MQKQSGFTLIELLVLVAIVAILATVAAPDFSTTIKNGQDISQSNSLITGLAVARSEAIKSDDNVSICAGTTLACSGPTWAAGWVVYYNAPLPAGITNPIIRVFPAISGNNTFTSNNGYSFTFQASGLLLTPPAPPITFTLCDPRGTTFARAIDLGTAGQAEAAPEAGFEIDGVTAITSC
ncbi:MAG: GspH/FimT family pseudopilin [Gammaproteobacteria bacterium]